MSQSTIARTALVVICGLFLLALWRFDFTQDDAYITFRYAANFEAGHGLVWNLGERLEGYTNFFWLILIVFFKNLGISYLLSVKALGGALSVGSIFLCYSLGKSTYANSSGGASSRQAEIVGISAALLLAGNYAFIYWTVAGLETALFTFLTLAALSLYQRRSWLLIPVLALAVLTRPEGALLAGFFLLYPVVVHRRIPKNELIAVGLAVLLTIPFLVFKWSYFGGLLPNPFYAKTAWDSQQISAGLEYLWTFLSGYTVFGLVYLIPLVFFARLSRFARGLYLFAGLYTLYITLVGGDVLKVGRFFLPLLAPLYISFMFAVVVGLRKQALIYALPAVTLALALWLPYDRVYAYLEQERGFSRKMTKIAEPLLASDSSNFSVATPTIGKIGYILQGHDIYDMVGLTDSTVSRHPQEPITGLESSWRERKYNAEYILRREPDYILFSTSIKPSSPGERALFLYPAFLNGYSVIGHVFGGRMNDLYRRNDTPLGEIVRTLDPGFVQEYVKGIETWQRGEYPAAINAFSTALRLGPPQGYGYIYYFLGNCLIRRGDSEGALKALNRSLELDSTIYPSHLELYSGYSRTPGYQAQAQFHRDYLYALMPWARRDIDSIIAANK